MEVASNSVKIQQIPSPGNEKSVKGKVMKLKNLIYTKKIYSAIRTQEGG